MMKHSLGNLRRNKATLAVLATSTTLALGVRVPAFAQTGAPVRTYPDAHSIDVASGSTMT